MINPCSRLYVVFSVCDWAGTSADSTVMDVCCGTGTVGIILAKSVHKVIGIEMS